MYERITRWAAGYVNDRRRTYTQNINRISYGGENLPLYVINHASSPWEGSIGRNAEKTGKSATAAYEIGHGKSGA